MRLEQDFEVKAPIERGWKALFDLERLAPCLPGAAIERRAEDGSGAFAAERRRLG